MTEFPNDAKNVLDWIRAVTVAPPEQVHDPYSSIRWCVGTRHCCPLGMTPGAKWSCPISLKELSNVPADITNVEIATFIDWFDTQRDAKEVRSFIWQKLESI